MRSGYADVDAGEERGSEPPRDLLSFAGDAAAFVLAAVVLGPVVLQVFAALPGLDLAPAWSLPTAALTLVVATVYAAAVRGLPSD